jgi:putative restriction endonuclease
MINQYERAYRGWALLTRRAQAGRTITYGQLGKSLGIHHRAVRYVLGKIQDFCLVEKLPPLTILAVNQNSRKPSEGFIAWDVNDLDHGLKLVYGFAWDDMENPFQFAADGSTPDSLASELTDDDADAGDIYARAKVRGIAQQIFRQALLATYSHRCAFTGISFTPCLDAGHIVPWANATHTQRMDPRNGILMSSFHHRLFDQYLMTIDDDCHIRYYDPEMKRRTYTDWDKALTVDLHGTMMRLPLSERHRPDKEAIKTRNKEINWMD